MRSVWLALPVKSGNANQATVRAARRIIYAMLNAAYALVRRQSRKSKLFTSRSCARGFSTACLRSAALMPALRSKPVRSARSKSTSPSSPTAVRGHALALPCACAHSNTPAQLQKTNIKNNGKQKAFAKNSFMRHTKTKSASGNFF